ncbi:MAG: HAD family phosphatase [Synechococcaceae cyanobacterium SM2_3_1]|nr:HAD family phosphatase [Synechococcaceae cyanobacterium SM2_3_1]
MTLKAVLLGYSGVVVNDENVHAEVINQLLLADNLRPLNLADQQGYRLLYMGHRDAERIRTLWGERGRVLPPKQLQTLLEQKEQLYQQAMQQRSRIPLIPHLVETLERLHRLDLDIILVSGNAAGEVQEVLRRCQLESFFRLQITGSDLPLDKIDSPGYLHRLALEHLSLTARECLGIEATYPGLAAGQAAAISMLGIATLFPLHMLQRRANWVVDGLAQVEWDRLCRWFATGEDRPPTLDPVLPSS